MKGLIITLCALLMASSQLFAQKVTMYKTSNFTGEKLEVTGDVWGYPSNRSWNDRVNSIKVPSGWKVIVYKHCNGGGTPHGDNLEITGDWVASGVWVNQVSGIKVIKSKNVLNAGETLNAGQKLTSSNGAYVLAMQTDGNLCIYKSNNGKQGAFVWGSMKHGFSNGKVIMQTDGNFVVYDETNKPKWSSKTHPFFNAKYKNSGNKPVKLVLENTGKIQLYNSRNQVMWSNK